MSKAFLRESDFDDVPDRPRASALLAPGVTNLLTESGAARLRDALRELVEVERPPLAAAAASAADRRSELLALDQRIRRLRAVLDSAEIVPREGGPPGVVRFGCGVTLREGTGPAERLRIVGVDEVGDDAESVSWQAPLARALIGDRVRFRAPGGARELEVIAVEP